MNPRYRLNDPDAFLSPSLIVFRAIVRENLEAMIRMARGVERLRPHVKTHKMAAVVKMAEGLGIRKHKVATVAEAEMVAAAGREGGGDGRTDVLLAYPVVGPNIARVARLIKEFPDATFRVLVDHPEAARALSAGMGSIDRPLEALVDLEIGMGRTGIDPGEPAFQLYRLLDELPNVAPGGLSAYDGHIQISDIDERRKAVAIGVEKTLALRDRLLAAGLPVPRLVMGGTPTFPIHAESNAPGVECSPGTCTFHDGGYGAKFPDLPFAPAALLITRVISIPRSNRLCLDLGHKAIAADVPGARLALPELPDAKFLIHSEEHLVVETDEASRYRPGDHFLAIPTHVCPTSALHQSVYVVENGDLVDRWEVSARNRVIGV